MTRIRLLPEAEEELRAAARFYEALQPGLGLALLQEVRRAREHIAERPKASRVDAWRHSGPKRSSLSLSSLLPGPS